MRPNLLIVLMALTVASASLAANKEGREQFWGQWRGPDGSGVSATAKPPVEWSETKNVRWKRELPGQGASTPIVWGNLVYVQAAVPVERAADGETREGPPASGPESTAKPGGAVSQSAPSWRGGPRPKNAFNFTIMALERKTGGLVWERVVREEIPHEGNHRDGTLASSSPVTDGEHVFAYFGSRGLYCLNPQGEILWKKDFGDMRIENQFGEGSSPVLHGDTVVVNWDQEGDSFIVALDAATGQERWRQARDEATSWSSPHVIAGADPVQVVVSASKRVRSYDLASGQVLWECGGLGENCVPTPVAGGGIVFAMSGHRQPALLAIRYPGAKGDLTGSDAVVWRLDTGTPYVPSPLLYGNLLYLAQKNDAILSCFEAKTGQPHYTRQRLEELTGLYSSLVGADGRVYVVARNGAAGVIKHGPELEVLAVNKLDDRFTASPALAGSEIYLRGHKYLYCIAE